MNDGCLGGFGNVFVMVCGWVLFLDIDGVVFVWFVELYVKVV